jgi:fused signal recognition particle receptor
MPPSGLFQRLKAFFFSGSTPSLEELEDILIESDLGYKTAMALSEELNLIAKAGKLRTEPELRLALKDLLKKNLRVAELPYHPENLNLYLFLGVNGVGKTTSIAKMAYRFAASGQGPILLAAGDTFRAAAVEQIRLHGKKLEVRVVGQGQGADPASVLFDSLESARAQGEKIVLADTAGRMHTKANLVKELQKILKIAQSKIGDGHFQKILVIDATTGQNAFEQAKTFHEAVGVDGLILSKYDSSGRGGIAVSICRELGLPFFFYGTGEKLQDLEPFDVDRFVTGLLGDA